MRTYNDDSTFLERHVLTIFVVLCVLATAAFVLPALQAHVAQIGQVLR